MERREVEIRRKENLNDPIKIGIFHSYEDYKDGNVSCKKALVELKDGTVQRFDIDEIKFTNRPIGGNLFEDGI